MIRVTQGGAAVKDVVHFDGQEYTSLTLPAPEPYARRCILPASQLHEIGVGTRPRCRSGDGPGADSAHSDLVPVASIEGVSPEIAIAVMPEGMVYVRQGAEVPSALTLGPRGPDR